MKAESANTGLARLQTTLSRWRWTLLAVVVLVGTAFLWATTIGGLGRPQGRFAGAHDFIYFYVGGACLREGTNPYDYEMYTAWARAHLADDPFVDKSTRGVDTGYAYPPTAGVPFWLLAHAGFNTARLLFLALNWVSLAAVLAVMWWAAREHEQGRTQGAAPTSSAPHWAWAAPIFVTGFALTNPFTSHNMWMGQSSLVALAILCGAWWAKEKNYWLLCAFLTALATAKISMSVFFVLTLLVEKRWKTFFVTCILCFGLAAIPLWQEGPIGLAQSWLEALKRYRDARPSQPEGTEAFGLRSLATVWLGFRTPIWGVVGLLCFGALTLRRKWFTSLEFFAIGLALAALFVKGNDYDLVLLVPLLLVCLLRTAPSLLWTCIVLAAFALLAFPKRIYLEKMGTPALLRIRELTLLAVTAWIIVQAMTKPTPSSAAATK